MPRLRVAVLISGRGSNLRSLVQASKEGRMDADVVLVASNRAEAGGLEFAKGEGISTFVSPSKGRPREEHERELAGAIDASGADLVALAGYMRILSASFVRRYLGRLVNVHPALLPAFPGLDAQGQAHAAGVRIAGCSTHFVTEEMDAGPVLVQAAVAIPPGASPDEVAARVLEAEHRIYPLTIHHLAQGRVRFEGGRAVWRDPPETPRAMLISPGGA